MYEYDPFSLIQRSLTVEKNTKIHIRSSSARRRKLTPLVSLIRSTKTFIAPYCTRYPTLTMKLFAAVITASLAITQAFVVSPSYASTSTQLNAVAPLDRRGLLSNAAALAVGSVLVAAPGTALAEYVPKFDDMKQIYILGVSLDRLADRLSNPDTVELGLDGVRQFNKNPGFYPGYAKNFIMKSVPKGSDSDPRVGYVKQACKLVGSIEDTVIVGSSTDEAVSRVRKAQSLISKFLAESGVKDEGIDAFIASHK